MEDKQTINKQQLMDVFLEKYGAKKKLADELDEEIFNTPSKKEYNPNSWTYGLPQPHARIHYVSPKDLEATGFIKMEPGSRIGTITKSGTLYYGESSVHVTEGTQIEIT